MERHHLNNDTQSHELHVPRDWTRLIHKLRWIGLEEEAKRLEAAVSTLPPEERAQISAGPYSTD
jgi:hypothetical protein